MNQELTDTQLDLEKAEPEIKLPTSNGSQKKQKNYRKTSTSASLTTLKPLSLWIATNCGKFLKRWEYQTTLPASCETCMQVKKQQLEPDINNGPVPNWKRSVFIPIPKKGNAKECSNYLIIVLISHASKVMLKILQARLQQYVNQDFQMFKLDLEKAEEPEIKLPTSAGSWKKQESSKKIHLLH